MRNDPSNALPTEIIPTSNALPTPLQPPSNGLTRVLPTHPYNPHGVAPALCGAVHAFKRERNRSLMDAPGGGHVDPPCPSLSGPVWCLGNYKLG